jgi:transcriptional regulator with PAS, ATPase and Fis domain
LEWLDNIRELEYFMERALTLARSKPLIMARL